ncbi:MAG TPA: hypothetical protein VFL57_09810 [Bryobacteraceae bacterium]|nr:hypothetical protein [Bryobacteraceae bacterium]
MTIVTPKILLGIGAVAAIPALFVAQQTPDAAPRRITEQPGAVAVASRRATPQLSREQQEVFLRTARIEKMWQLTEGATELTAGSTRSWRATLSNGQLRHDAHLQFIDIYRPVFRGRNGTVEKNFRDTWKFNVAAYRLDRLLGLNMIPVSVEREIEGRIGSVTWWIDDVMMDEAKRRDTKTKPPATQEWVDQLNKVRVFDQLIYNTDRNQGNLLITHDWKLWIIDHTRAFRTQHTLLKPDALTRCDQGLLDAMRKLNQATLMREIGPWVRPEEITALLARRDVIVRFFNSEVQTKGADAVLTGVPRKTPEVSVP